MNQKTIYLLLNEFGKYKGKKVNLLELTEIFELNHNKLAGKVHTSEIEQIALEAGVLINV